MVHWTFLGLMLASRLALIAEPTSSQATPQAPQALPQTPPQPAPTAAPVEAPNGTTTEPPMEATKAPPTHNPFAVPPTTAPPTTVDRAHPDSGAQPGSDRSATDIDPSTTKRHRLADVSTWADRHTVHASMAAALLSHAQMRDNAAQDGSVSETWLLTVGYTHAFHERIVLGGQARASPWQSPLAPIFGYPTWWTIDVVAAPMLRISFGQRARSGLLVGPVGGMTFNVAPTNDQLTAVRETPGLGLGWNVGVELDSYFYIGKRLGLLLTIASQIQRYRHRWRFSSHDGTLSDTSETIRYRHLRFTIGAGFTYAL